MIRLIPSPRDPCTSHCEEDSVRAIRAFDNTILHWVSLGRGQGVYELRAGDEVVGTLRRVKLPGSLCVLDTADGTWTCKRSSRLAAAVTVRVAGEETNYAVFTHHWPTTGTLDLGNGRKFRWHAAHRRQRFWKWTDASNRWVVRLTQEGESPAPVARVDLAPGAGDLPDISLLITLGWYVALLELESATASL
jgi:hypothetical protein